MNFSTLFPYHELNWYGFGVRVGMANLQRHGLALGLKKSFGKVTQPINSYTRFPEYELFGRAVAEVLQDSPSPTPRILDIGSPKLFGLFLACHYPANVHLTDINALNLREYILLWEAIRAEARGRVTFLRHDGCAAPFRAESFDVVYAMSVVEHIPGPAGDSATLRQMVAALRPGGGLIVSVPFGPRPLEQFARGFNYEHGAGTSGINFFQRIYNAELAEQRLIKPIVDHVDELRCWTVSRRQGLAPLYHRVRAAMGEELAGLMGFINPVASLLLNQHQDSLVDTIAGSYSGLRSSEDLYGDLIITARKRR